MKKILDVGNCDPDHASIRRMLTPLDAELTRVHSAEEAIQALDGGRFDLVLINRIFDRNGESGLQLIESIQQRDNPPPVMLISNFAEAQQEAVQAGAAPGFGKSELGGPAIERVKAALNE